MPSNPDQFLPLSIPHLAGREWEYVKDCLDTGWVSSVGSYVNKFEDEFAQAVGTSHAVATSNGTTALQVALQVCGVKPGDQVLVSDLTFIASANSISHLGATPIFIDAETRYWQMDPAIVADYLGNECTYLNGETFHKASGQRVKAIMPVHILGNPVNMDPLLELAQEYNIAIVEDATESLGAEYKHRKLGSVGDAAAFSFNGNKLITTGGGGMITTNHEALAKRAKHLTTTAKTDPIEFIHDEIGYNYRLVNILAAIGCAQLEQLEAFLAKKREIANWYNSFFDHNHHIVIMPEPEYGKSALWLYTVRFPERDSRPILKTLEAKQIQTRPLWQCMHQSPAYSHLPKRENINSALLQRECLSLPCSVSLTQADVERVAESVLDALKN